MGGYPCGVNTVTGKCSKFSKEWFVQLDKQREIDEPWMDREFNWIRKKIHGKRVLEIGYGMGRNHVKLAESSGELFGIDITPRNKGITQKHLESYGMKSNLQIGDAEKLPFPKAYFDFVYSFGVLHHTPDMKKAINEVYRVLKPGGMAWIV